MTIIELSNHVQSLSLDVFVIHVSFILCTVVVVKTAKVLQYICVHVHQTAAFRAQVSNSYKLILHY